MKRKLTYLLILSLFLSVVPLVSQNAAQPSGNVPATTEQTNQGDTDTNSSNDSSSESDSVVGSEFKDDPDGEDSTFLEKLFAEIAKFKPAFIVLILFFALYFGAKYLLDQRKSKTNTEWSIIETFILFSIIAIGVITFIISLPLPEDMRDGVVSLLGIAISGALAFSSASFIGNGLSGILLKVINNFRIGDFIRIDEHFGRVSERGLFHTEIQGENRDLTTLPNKMLTEVPVKVIRTSGTFISAEVSLGYDVNRSKIEKVLIKAAKAAGLKDPFVHVVSLGDFSIVYRVHGLLENVKKIVSMRSSLNGQVLDALHDARIEIVSPTFMNQRQVNETIFIPKKMRPQEADAGAKEPEDIIFDKAEQAEELEKKKETLAEVEAKIADMKAELKAAETDEAKAAVQKRLDNYSGIHERMLSRIEQNIDKIT